MDEWMDRWLDIINYTLCGPPINEKEIRKQNKRNKREEKKEKERKKNKKTIKYEKNRIKTSKLDVDPPVLTL